MDHDVMHRQVGVLWKWYNENKDAVAFVREHMPSPEERAEYLRHKAEIEAEPKTIGELMAEEQARKDEAAGLTEAHHVDSDGAGTETKVEDGADPLDMNGMPPKDGEKEPEGALDVTKVQTAHIDGKVTLTPADEGANAGATEAAGASGEKTGTEAPAEAKKAPAGLPPTAGSE